jgi:hypothetical protein
MNTKFSAQFNQQVFAPYTVNGLLAGQFKTAGTLSVIPLFMSDIYPLTSIAARTSVFTAPGTRCPPTRFVACAASGVVLTLFSC